MIEDNQTNKDMKVTIEKSPSAHSYRVEMGEIISFLYTTLFTVKEKVDILEKNFGEKWFFYLGGGHIAIHELTEKGVPREERLIFVEL